MPEFSTLTGGYLGTYSLTFFETASFRAPAKEITNLIIPVEILYILC